MEKPWTVFLMANVASDPITECEIDIHQYPDEYVYYRNQLESPFQQRWIILMRIRNLTFNEAESSALNWLNKTRGTQRYIAKGFYLARGLMVDKYGPDFDSQAQDNADENMPLALEIVPYSKQESLEIMNVLYSKHIVWPPPPLDTVLTEFCNTPCVTHHVLSEQRENNYKAKMTQLPKPFQKQKCLADFVRMVDLHENAVSSISPTLLRRFVTVFAETLSVYW